MPSGPLQFIAQMRAVLAKGGKEAMQGTIGMGGRVAGWHAFIRLKPRHFIQQQLSEPWTKSNFSFVGDLVLHLAFARMCSHLVTFFAIPFQNVLNIMCSQMFVKLSRPMPNPGISFRHLSFYQSHWKE